MASALYDKGRQKWLEGDIAWLTDDIRAILIDLADYTPNLATDDFLDDIPAAAREEVSGSLTGKTSTDGTADCNDIVWSGAAGDPIEAIVVYKHTGTDSTSPLLVFIDNPAELPLTLNGGDVTLVVHANGLFTL